MGNRMAQTSSGRGLRLGYTKRRLLLLGILLLSLYVVLPQIGSLSSGWAALRHANQQYVVVGFAAMMLTYVVAAITYTALSLKRLQYHRTVLVQLTGAFINRLLPAGVGGMGLNAQYLRKSGHSVSEALVVVAANNTMGALAGMLLAGGALASGGAPFYRWRLPVWDWWYAGIIVTLIVLGIVASYSSKWRSAARRSLSGAVRTLSTYRAEPGRLALALVSSIALALLHIFILWCVGQAIGLPLALPAYVVVFSAGTLVGAASPTPGGLIGAEAGLVAAFVTYGVPPSMGLAGALLYRLLTYWLPLLPGAIAFMVIRKRLGL